MSGPFDSLKPLAGRALEAALNRAVALDPDSRDALQELEGQRISLTLEAPALALQISVHERRLQVGPVDPQQEPELAVRGSLSALLGQLPWMANARRGQSEATGRLRVAGDAELARRLQQLASRFDPDWQQPFVAVFGEVLGVQMANAVRDALCRFRQGATDLAGNVAEFITEESRDVVPQAELEAFHDDVDVVHDDVERLAARIARLGAGA